MISKEQLVGMQNAIHSLRATWGEAVENNLKEKAGHHFGFDDREGEIMLSVLDPDDNQIDAVFDAILYDSERKQIVVHCIEWNGDPCDNYQTLDIFDDNTIDIIYSSIDFD